MNPTLSIHEGAEAEINEAADFYDLESPGLGGVFLDEIQRALQRIVDFPEAAPLVRGRVRKRIVTKFPYSLLYSMRGSEIRVLAVAHHKRRPFYWRGRR
ncbi:MAG: type II toxin-antitoxin system RelE/ParE family toxin [Acidobacteriota bacterium]